MQTRTCSALLFALLASCGPGSDWRPVPTQFSIGLSALWGSGPDDIWGVGAITGGSNNSGFFWGNSGGGSDPIAAHWNGARWTNESWKESNLLDVWGSAPDDVWAVGDSGTILRRAGASWVRVTSGTTYGLRSIWGTGPKSIWAVGDKQQILRWDGSVWKTVFGGDSEDSLLNVWGTGPNDVWAVGSRGIVLHWDGIAWTSVPSGTDAFLTRAWGSGPNDVWMVGVTPGGQAVVHHWDGIALTAVPIDGPPKQKERCCGPDGKAVNYNGLSGLWGSGPHDVWAVGTNGTVLHWDGMAWAYDEAGTDDVLGGVWGTGPDNVWIAGAHSVLRRSRAK